MGLAEPRKRIKLSHDPRNLSWSQASDSFGARIMQSSGWKPGTALGASSVPIPAYEASAAKVKISVKDDTLGLGASLKSKNVEHQRTGLDAFQGLLGRLNAKDEVELKKVEEKAENRKLVLFAQGRWGGMVFVPGGLLVQEDPTKVKENIKQESNKMTAEEAKSEDAENERDSQAETSDEAQKAEKRRKREGETAEERAKRKAEKKQRKEERRARTEAKQPRKLRKQSGTSTPASEATETEGTSTSTSTGTGTGTSTPVTQEKLRNGRHLLRGRNIQAKRMAFSDAKGLDQIFMRQQQQQQQQAA